jgi:hypothetical protein
VGPVPVDVTDPHASAPPTDWQSRFFLPITAVTQLGSMVFLSYLASSLGAPRAARGVSLLHRAVEEGPRTRALGEMRPLPAPRIRLLSRLPMHLRLRVYALESFRRNPADHCRLPPVSYVGSVGVAEGLSVSGTLPRLPPPWDS